VGAQVILASADSSLKAGMLRTLKARIDRIVHYSSVYDAAMRRHRREVRSRRKSTYAKIMAAVTLRATGGTIRCLAAFRKLERKASGNVSGVSTVGEAEGSEIVWEHVKGDLDIYITQDGHGVSLRKVLEAEILNYEQGEPTKKAHVTPAGRKVAPKPAVTETKHTASVLAAMGGTAETAPVLRPKQSKYVVKVTFDARQISKTKAQTEVMLLLIPEGEEGQFYCQSALRIRTVLVYTGKDGKEQLQANLGKVMEEIEDVRVRGLRYCASADTFVGQDPDQPLKDGDRNVAVEFFMPADMCSHFGLFGHGGGRDPTKCFCTHCKCRMDQRHTLFQLVRLPTSETVGEVAKAYGIKVETLWMLNAGFDPTGQLPPAELTDKALFFKTLPLK
jgi:hypothetical protein